jgi:hypothetical protein
MAHAECDRCSGETTTDFTVEVSPATLLDPPEYLVICEECQIQDEIGRELAGDEMTSWNDC